MTERALERKADRKAGRADDRRETRGRHAEDPKRRNDHQNDKPVIDQARQEAAQGLVDTARARHRRHGDLPHAAGNEEADNKDKKRADDARNIGDRLFHHSPNERHGDVDIGGVVYILHGNLRSCSARTSSLYRRINGERG